MLMLMLAAKYLGPVKPSSTYGTHFGRVLNCLHGVEEKAFVLPRIIEWTVLPITFELGPWGARGDRPGSGQLGNGTGLPARCATGIMIKIEALGAA